MSSQDLEFFSRLEILIPLIPRAVGLWVISSSPSANAGIKFRFPLKSVPNTLPLKYPDG